MHADVCNHVHVDCPRSQLSLHRLFDRAIDFLEIQQMVSAKYHTPRISGSALMTFCHLVMMAEGYSKIKVFWNVLLRKLVV